MESRANPNPRGCLAKALPNEPFFVLLARDACAPDSIRFWADQRAQLGVEEGESQDAEQLTEALETADVMETWREENDGAWRNQRTAGSSTPPREIVSLARTIIGRPALHLTAVEAGVPVSSEKFNSLLTDAKKLADFLLDVELQSSVDA